MPTDAIVLSFPTRAAANPVRKAAAEPAPKPAAPQTFVITVAAPIGVEPMFQTPDPAAIAAFQDMMDAEEARRRAEHFNAGHWLTRAHFIVTDTLCRAITDLHRAARQAISVAAWLGGWAGVFALGAGAAVGTYTLIAIIGRYFGVGS